MGNKGFQMEAPPPPRERVPLRLRMEHAHLQQLDLLLGDLLVLVTEAVV